LIESTPSILGVTGWESDVLPPPVEACEERGNRIVWLVGGMREIREKGGMGECEFEGRI